MSRIIERELIVTCEVQIVFTATFDQANVIELMLQDMPEIGYAMWDESGCKWRVAIQSESMDDIERCESKLIEVIEALI